MPVEIIEPLPLDAFFRPDRWPQGTGALMTTRVGGVSSAPFDSLNLKAQTADPLDQIAVAENRRRFATTLGATPVFLDQVHGTRVVRLTAAHLSPDAGIEQADASISTVPGIACTVMVADCLPVLFATRDGRAVGAAHAGWRGLAGGVLEAGGVGVAHQQATQLIVHHQQFSEGAAAVIVTAVKQDRTLLGQAIQAMLLDQFRWGLEGYSRGRVQAPHQALGENTADRGGNQVAFHAHVQQARDTRRSAVGVQGREDQMASE